MSDPRQILQDVRSETVEVMAKRRIAQQRGFATLVAEMDRELMDLLEMAEIAEALVVAHDILAA